MESAYVTRSSSFIEYMKLHLISLEQDSERVQKAMDEYSNYEDDAYRELEIEDISLNGQYIATAHLLSVANDIMMSTNERYN
jgi:hypothetical protein